MVDNKKFSKEMLEESKETFLEPRIKIGVNRGIKQLRIERDASKFIRNVADIDRLIERHIVNNCMKADTNDLRVKCIADTEKIRDKALNMMSEELSTVCDLKMEYR